MIFTTTDSRTLIKTYNTRDKPGYITLWNLFMLHHCKSWGWNMVLMNWGRTCWSRDRTRCKAQIGCSCIEWSLLDCLLCCTDSQLWSKTLSYPLSRSSSRWLWNVLVRSWSYSSDCAMQTWSASSVVVVVEESLWSLSTTSRLLRLGTCGELGNRLALTSFCPYPVYLTRLHRVFFCFRTEPSWASWRCLPRLWSGVCRLVWSPCLLDV